MYVTDQMEVTYVFTFVLCFAVGWQIKWNYSAVWRMDNWGVQQLLPLAQVLKGTLMQWKTIGHECYILCEPILVIWSVGWKYLCDLLLVENVRLCILLLDENLIYCMWCVLLDEKSSRMMSASMLVSMSALTSVSTSALMSLSTSLLAQCPHQHPR